jgi:type I restriction enzyme, S subunit
MDAELSQIKFSELFQEPPRNGVYKSQEFQGHGTKLVKMNELFRYPFIEGSQINFDKIELTEREKQKLLLRKDDLLFSRTSVVADGVGKCALIKEANEELTYDSNIFRIRLDGSKASSRFYYYYFGSPAGRSKVKSLASGAAITTISGTKLSDVYVPCPSLPIQRKIAEVLSAFDDLIEVNTRRIRILEQMAQSVYREWFGKVEERSLPEGWEIRKLSDITTKIGSGATPLGGENAYKTSGISLIRSLNVYDFNFSFDNLAFIDAEQAGKLNNVTVKENDILLNITGASVARCCMVPSYILPARVNQHVSIIRVDPNLSNAFYILYTINSESKKREILNLAQGGATREALTKNTLENFKIIQPPGMLLDEFGKFAKDIWLQQEILKRKNANMRRTRDLLLPRLVSGEIELQ